MEDNGTISLKEAYLLYMEKGILTSKAIDRDLDKSGYTNKNEADNIFHRLHNAYKANNKYICVNAIRKEYSRYSEDDWLEMKFKHWR